MIGWFRDWIYFLIGFFGFWILSDWIFGFSGLDGFGFLRLGFKGSIRLVFQDLDFSTKRITD
jgi:hypothetical protein